MVVGVARDLEQGLATKTVAQLVPGLVKLDELELLVQGQHELLCCLEALVVALHLARQQFLEGLGAEEAPVLLVLELLLPHQLASHEWKEWKGFADVLVFARVPRA